MDGEVHEGVPGRTHHPTPLEPSYRLLVAKAAKAPPKRHSLRALVLHGPSARRRAPLPGQRWSAGRCSSPMRDSCAKRSRVRAEANTTAGSGRQSPEQDRRKLGLARARRRVALDLSNPTPHEGRTATVRSCRSPERGAARGGGPAPIGSAAPKGPVPSPGASGRRRDPRRDCSRRSGRRPREADARHGAFREMAMPDREPRGGAAISRGSQPPNPLKTIRANGCHHRTRIAPALGSAGEGRKRPCGHPIDSADRRRP